MTSLGRRALTATAWLIMIRPAAMAIQLVRSLVLTRLLFPEDFGLMLIVGVVLQGLQMCSDTGLGPNIIRHRRGDDETFLQTIWTLGILRSALLWAACCALAVPVARFYENPLLASMLPVAGLSVLIAGFQTTAWSTHDREMKVRRASLVALSIDVASFVITVALAVWLRSVWALVWGNVVTTLVRVFVGFRALPGVRHRLRWHRETVRDAVQFGKWIFVSSLLTFLAMQTDRLLLGKLIPTGVLGVYSIALVLTNTPRAILSGLSSQVLFPAMSERSRDDPRRARTDFLRGRAVLLHAAAVLAVGLVTAAPAFFRVLYDPRYWDAAWMAQLLALSFWCSVLNVTSTPALLSRGDSRSLAEANVVNLAVTVGAGLIGFAFLDLAGFILGFALGTAAGEVIQGLALRRAGIGVLRQDLTTTLQGVAACGLVVAAAHGLEVVTGADPALLYGVAGAPVVALLTWRSWRELVPLLPADIVSRLRLGGWRRDSGGEGGSPDGVSRRATAADGSMPSERETP